MIKLTRLSRFSIKVFLHFLFVFFSIFLNLESLKMIVLSIKHSIVKISRENLDVSIIQSHENDAHVGSYMFLIW